MGKNSLIKSTSKKTADEEEKKKTPKKAAATKKKAAKAKTTTAKKTTKAKKASTSKAAPKAKKTTKTKAAPKTKKAAVKKAAPKKAAPKTKKAAAPKAKKAVKKTTKAKPKKAAPKKKPVTLKELIFKKFDVETPDKLFQPSLPTGPTVVTAPPYFDATSEAELKKLRGIQFRKYSAADLKAASQKADVDKAAAEKAAAEKAAAEKAAAEKVEAEPEVAVSYDQPPLTAEPADPMTKMFKYGIAGFAAIILLLIGSSMMNTGNFYLKAVNGSLEIWQGRFAPMGKDRLIVLTGMEAPAPVKEVYTKNEVYPLVFNFYVGKADELLTMQGMPDYEGIRTYLKKALKYASTPELRSAAYARLDSIEFMTLMIKTNVAVQKKTTDSLEEALGYLKETRALELDPEQVALVKSKTESIEKMIDELKAQEAAEAEAEAAAGK